MLELCELLKINVNELLIGEHIVMDNYKDIAEKKLVEMNNQEEKEKKKVILTVIGFAIIFYIVYCAGIDVGDTLGKFIYNISH